MSSKKKHPDWVPLVKMPISSALKWAVSKVWGKK